MAARFSPIYVWIELPASSQSEENTVPCPGARCQVKESVYESGEVGRATNAGVNLADYPAMSKCK